MCCWMLLVPHDSCIAFSDWRCGPVHGGRQSLRHPTVTMESWLRVGGLVCALHPSARAWDYGPQLALMGYRFYYSLFPFFLDGWKYHPGIKCWLATQRCTPESIPQFLPCQAQPFVVCNGAPWNRPRISCGKWLWLPALDCQTQDWVFRSMPRLKYSVSGGINLTLRDNLRNINRVICGLIYTCTHLDGFACPLVKSFRCVKIQIAIVDPCRST